MFCNNPRKNPRLPQYSTPKEQEKRAMQLARSKENYIWNDAAESLPGVPVAKKLPPDNKPTLAWIIKVIPIALEVVENTIKNSVEDGETETIDALKAAQKNLQAIKDSHKDYDDIFITSIIQLVLGRIKKAFIADIDTAIPELENLLALLKQHPVSNKLMQQSGLEQYQALFNTIKLNQLAKNFQEDKVFAYYRVSGPNPMLIESIAQLPQNFPVTEEGYQSVMTGDTLAQALAEKRIFLLNYKALQPLVDNPGDYDGLPKQLFAPLVLLARQDKDLFPVAIQRTQTAGDGSIVYATSNQSSPDFWPWQTAKSIVEMAEGNYHELFVHLARTHLLIEAFVLATHRNLADMHPVNILLLPHFEGTLFINKTAAGGLINEGGPIDHIFAASIATTQKAASDDRLSYNFYKNMLPTDLDQRGVKDESILPNYPYRDDGLLIWNKINKWVSEYINIYYSDDNDVIGDTELAAWASELMTTGKVAGFKPIESKADLIDVITMIIFTASAQHAAVNFPQSSIMTYAPAVSGSIWGEKNPSGANQQEWLNTMPPLKLAVDQLNLLHVLGGVYYRMLGSYRSNDFPYPGWFEDKKIIGEGMALDRFRSQLDEAEKEIERRNNTREYEYTYLLPSKIPMSINI